MENSELIKNIVLLNAVLGVVDNQIKAIGNREGDAAMAGCQVPDRIGAIKRQLNEISSEINDTLDDLSKVSPSDD